VSLSAAVIDALVAAGATVEQLAAAMKADIASQEAKEQARLEAKRAGNAERQQRFRDTRKGKSNGRNALRAVTERDAPPNDIYSNPPSTPVSAKADTPPLAEKVVSAWNEGPKAKGATGATALDSQRRKWLGLRVRDHGEAAVFLAIGNLAASPFHCGDNDRGWKANIGWLLKSPENFLKALEMGATTPGSGTKAPTTEEWNAFCDRSADRCRAMGRHDEATDWIGKKRLSDGQREASRKPQAIGDLVGRMATGAPH
jgi:hypothetical protein